MNCFHSSRYAAATSKLNKNVCFGTVNQYYSVLILLAGKYFIIGWIQSPYLLWDQSLGGWNGFLIRPWILIVHVFVILDIWWYLEQLRLKFTSYWAPEDWEFEQLFPQGSNFPCLACCTTRDPGLLHCVLQLWPWNPCYLLVFRK